VLNFIERFVEVNGYAPSFHEIARHLGLRSLATVHEHVANLVRKGYLRKHRNRSRALEPLRPSRLGAVELPLLGTVAAGLPIEAVVERETIAVPADLVPRGRNYVLRVRGDSMIEEQICDGDYIVVHAQPTAENGQMVVALIDGESATVKKFYRERDGRIRLQPANAHMPPLLYEPERVQIQGIVVAVIRLYR